MLGVDDLDSMKVISLRIDSQLEGELGAAAQRHGLTRSDLMRMLLRSVLAEGETLHERLAA